MPRAEEIALCSPVWNGMTWLIQLLAASCVIGETKGSDPAMCPVRMKTHSYQSDKCPVWEGLLNHSKSDKSQFLRFSEILNLK